MENFSWNPFGLPAAAHRKFLERTLRYVPAHGATQIYYGDARQFYADHPTLRPRLVFIDAAHDYDSVKRDIAWAVASGCRVILGHDYSPLWPGVTQAVDEAFGGAIEVFGSVWVHSRPQGDRPAAASS